MDAALLRRGWGGLECGARAGSPTPHTRARARAWENSKRSLQAGCAVHGAPEQSTHQCTATHRARPLYTRRQGLASWHQRAVCDTVSQVPHVSTVLLLQL